LRANRFYRPGGATFNSAGATGEQPPYFNACCNFRRGDFNAYL